MNELNNEIKDAHLILQRKLTNQQTDEGIDIVSYIFLLICTDKDIHQFV